MNSDEAYAAGLAKLQEAWRESPSDRTALPESLIRAIDGVISDSAQVSQRYALITQLLIKSVLQASDSRTLDNLGSDSFSARSFAKYTTAKFDPVTRRIGNSADPYVSNPLRTPRLDDSLLSGRGAEVWFSLFHVLDSVDSRPELTEGAITYTLNRVRARHEESPALKTTPSAPPVSGHLASLLDHTGLDENLLLDMLDVLESDQPQIILAGPPGTSKTHTAQALANFLTDRDDSRVSTVQLHATYGYEDFVEGLRPVASDSGALTFQVARGVLRRLASECEPEDGPSDPRKRVLILDEMNRANLPRVLGELLFAIERRGEPVDLLHTTGFRLPPQLVFIGTMNTADRSIRSIDAAVRRRFQIFELPPSSTVLEGFYSEQGNEVSDLAAGLLGLNERLTSLLDRHHTVGHTFLMDERGMTSGRLTQVWLRQLRPLIEEYLFDMPEELAEFKVDTFWPSTAT